MPKKKPSQYILPTKNYITFESSLNKLAHFLRTAEEWYDTQVRILRWRVRFAKRELPQLERQMDEFLKKAKLSKADEKRFNKIGGRVEELTDIDILVPTEIKLLRQSPELIRILGLSHLVTIYEGYLADIVQEILLSHLDILKSGKQLTAEEVLTLGGRKQVVNYLVEKEVDELPHSPFQKVVKYFDDKFNINLNTSVAPPEKITEILATRNIHVHNRGIVNRHFQDLVKGSTLRLGTYKCITKEYLQFAIICINTIVRFIDTEARAKYLTS